MPPRPKFYLTTAIDYPNSPPHIGTAFEKIGADVQARYRRMQGWDVHFLMGNDENTIKVSKRAEELGCDPKAYVDDMAVQFKAVWRRLEISYDDFIQTSEARHVRGCQQFIQRVYDAGDIYKAAYEALYCEGCEEFKTTSQLQEGRCPNHPSLELKHVQEENYFFALSKYRDRLLDFYRASPTFIQPEIRKNEMVSLVESGLQDVSVSRRDFKWGIDLPFDGEQKIYVWFDALLNYITAIGFGSDDEQFRARWPADLHFIGKDITRFHCALWPAMLMSAGLELPRQVFAHGFVYHKGEKMSKTLGNIVDPMKLADEFGADAFRYYFLRECPFGGDGDFSYDRFIALYNSDLANNLGNLYSRTITMFQRYLGGVAGRETSPAAEGIPAIFAGVDLPALVVRLKQQVEACNYSQALAAVWQEVLDTANRYVEQHKPFELARTDLAACSRVLENLAEGLRVAAVLIKPFLPGAAERIYNGFEGPVPFDEVRFEHAAEIPRRSGPVRLTAELDANGKVPPLFPRIQPAQA